MSEACINLDLFFRQNLFPKVVKLLPKTTHYLGLKTFIQNFDAFVRCTLMGNQPWPQFQNGIRERSIGRRNSKTRKAAWAGAGAGPGAGPGPGPVLRTHNVVSI